MNIELYQAEMDIALSLFIPPEIGAEAEVILDFEVSSLSYFISLMAGHTLKVCGNDRAEVVFLRGQVISSLRVLYSVIQLGLQKEFPNDGAGVTKQKVSAKFARILEGISRVSRDKNVDYSPYNILKCGNIGLQTRIGDKISRICNLVLHGVTSRVVDEGVLDTAGDLVNYCVYHVMVAKDEWVSDEERDWWIDFLIERQGNHRLAQYYKKCGEKAVCVR